MLETTKLDKTCRFLEKILLQLNSTQRNSETIEKYLLFIFSLIDKSGIQSDLLSFYHASLLFRLGQITKKKLYFHSALNKLQEFDIQNYKSNFLYAKILLCLTEYSEDGNLIEEAISHLNKCPRDMEVLWSLGYAYINLGKYSFEISDFKKGIEAYRQVVDCHHPLFWVDVAEGLYILGSFTHDKATLQQAIETLQNFIVNIESVKKKPFLYEHILHGKDKRGHTRAWVLYVKAKKRMCELEETSVENLDSLFFDAISSAPEEKILWTEWSELYIRQGWLRKDFSLIEKGLSHISHTFYGKISVKKEEGLQTGRWIEPIIFAEALAILGLFAEELKLIKEAERVIKMAMEVLPHNAECFHAKGILYLCLGLYYADRKHLLVAVQCFKKGLSIYNRSFYLWHGLFETYFAIAIISNDARFFQKAIETNEYLLKLRPNSPLLHYESAMTLLQASMDDEEILFAACEKFEEILAINNDPKCIYRYAEALDRLGEVTGHSMYFEKGIDLLMRLQLAGDQSISLQYTLGLLYAHLGEHEEDEETLYRAHYLFESVAKRRTEDASFFCEWGYILLHLSQCKSEQSIQRQKLRVQAEEKLVKALEHGNFEAHYLLACLYSLASQFELSMEQLQKAQEKAVLPSFSDMENDSWLDGVRSTPAFCKFAEVYRDEQP